MSSFPTFRINQYLDGLKRIGSGFTMMENQNKSHISGQVVGDMDLEPIRKNESQNA